MNCKCQWAVTSISYYDKNLHQRLHCSEYKFFQKKKWKMNLAHKIGFYLFFCIAQHFCSDSHSLSYLFKKVTKFENEKTRAKQKRFYQFTNWQNNIIWKLFEVFDDMLFPRQVCDCRYDSVRML